LRFISTAFVPGHEFEHALFILTSLEDTINEWQRAMNEKAFASAIACGCFLLWAGGDPLRSIPFGRHEKMLRSASALAYSAIWRYKGLRRHDREYEKKGTQHVHREGCCCEPAYLWIFFGSLVIVDQQHAPMHGLEIK
jgi:hypothetical protein